MNQYQILEKILGNKHCPVCNRTLTILENFATCKSCGFSQQLSYRDSKRNKVEKLCIRYRKIEELLRIDTK